MLSPFKRRGFTGFSLIELLIALSLTLGLGAAMFQLVHQNERVFRDQHLIIEMQQSARAVASQIIDEVRMAGEGVPVFAASFDTATYEAVSPILASSSSTRMDFRAGLSTIETSVTSLPPIDLTSGLSQTIAVTEGSSFPNGRFVFIWGQTLDSQWAWVRAELTNVNSTSLSLTPRQAGDAGRASTNVTRFAKAPTVSLEEAVSFTFSANAIRRATATSMTNLSSPTWSAANEIGRNFKSLTFTYYDQNNNPVLPNTLAARASIIRVDVRLVAQTAGPLSNGLIPSYTVTERTILRNVKFR